MIKFFRKIRKKLADDNKPIKYFRYAIGEILLVVIGILIALSINNWNEERKLLIQEKAILEELDKNLQSNIEILESYIIKEEKRKRELNMIINHIDKRAPYNDSLGIYLRKVRMGEYISLVTSAFESLKSVGFNLIRSNELRMKIIHLFNYEYVQNMKTISIIANVQYQSTHEIFTKFLSFNDDQPEHRAIPNHYTSFLDNNEIYNLLTHRKAGKNGVIDKASIMLKETKKLRKLMLDLD